ncbi:MAG: hypothetical protein QXS20_05105 [Candidatus Thorarchaeota archaeon]
MTVRGLTCVWRIQAIMRATSGRELVRVQRMAKTVSNTIRENEVSRDIT